VVELLFFVTVPGYLLMLCDFPALLPASIYSAAICGLKTIRSSCHRDCWPRPHSSRRSSGLGSAGAGIPAYSSGRFRVLARGTGKAMCKTVSSSLGQPWQHDVLPPQRCVSIENEHGMALTSMPLSPP